MSLTFAQKIFGVALVVLTFMLGVAVYSVRLTAEITDYLDVVANRYVPANDAASLINEHVLEQNIVIGRALVSGAAALAPDSLARAADEFEALHRSVVEEFDTVRELLRSDSQISSRYQREVEDLEQALDAIEVEYFEFVADVRIFLADTDSGEDEPSNTRIDEVLDEEDLLDSEVAELRRVVAEFTRQSVLRAESLEQTLLTTNIILTAMATILGLASAMIVTRRLVAGVHVLVRGAELVESGDLDASVSVRSRDEIGDLGTAFNHMVGELRLKERIKETFGRYMDHRIVSSLLDSPELVEPGGERREMTVMFIDLKNFTSISEVLAPDDLVGMINGFFSHMTEALSNHGAVIDKFMGDAVMAFWGPPFTGPDEHAKLACAAAREAIASLEVFRAEVKRDLGHLGKLADIDLRIGISTGEMVIGTIGSKVSMSFTVMGDHVNLGSRLESANKAYGTRVLISERTRELAGGDVRTREIDFIRVKGKNEPVRAFELLLPLAGHSPMTESSQKAFEVGLQAYRKQDWDGAERAFRTCLQSDSRDLAATCYLERIGHFRNEPPDQDWDGTWTFLSK